MRSALALLESFDSDRVVVYRVDDRSELPCDGLLRVGKAALHLLIEQSDRFRDSAEPGIGVFVQHTHVPAEFVEPAVRVRCELRELGLHLPDPRPEVTDLRPKVTNLRPEVIDLRPEVIDLRFKVTYPRPEVINLRFKVTYPRPEVTDLRFKVTHLRREVTDLRLEFSDPRPQLSNPGRQLSDMRGQLPHVRGHVFQPPVDPVEPLFTHPCLHVMADDDTSSAVEMEEQPACRAVSRGVRRIRLEDCNNDNVLRYGRSQTLQRIAPAAV